MADEHRQCDMRIVSIGGVLGNVAVHRKGATFDDAQNECEGRFEIHSPVRGFLIGIIRLPPTSPTRSRQK